MRPFEIDDYIYDNELIFAYCNIFKPSIEKIAMDSDLIFYNLEKKEWFNEKMKNGLNILDVVESPNKYKQHYQRMVDADIRYPIIIWKEKNMIIDGNHRLGHSFLNRHKFINAYIFDNNLIKKFRIGNFKTRHEYKKNY